MRKVKESEVPKDIRKSPKGAFALTRQHVSLKLGGIANVGTYGGGHPFDIELTTIPAGKKNYPYHAHVSQWEYYIIISGRGRFLDNDRAWHTIEVGDHLICPPGEAHQIENDGDVDLVFYVIADNPLADVASYPNTDKRYLRPENKLIQFTEADYYAGEE